MSNQMLVLKFHMMAQAPIFKYFSLLGVFGLCHHKKEKKSDKTKLLQNSTENQRKVENCCKHSSLLNSIPKRCSIFCKCKPATRYRVTMGTHAPSHARCPATALALWARAPEKQFGRKHVESNI
jgi:hypothetical protein